MFFHPRRFLIILICGLVLANACAGLLVPEPVRADVGVQPILPVGSSIKPDKETPIQMTGEVVSMTVRGASETDNELVKLNPMAYGYETLPVWYPGIAEVEADFSMKNPTKDEVRMTVWFPLASVLKKVSWELNPDETVPRIESFQVTVNNKPVVFEVSEWPNPRGADKPALPWASFPVTFPPGKKTNIHVSYMLPLQPVPKQPVMELNYIFQTGAGWAGPIGQAKLNVNLPYPASEETMANIPPGAELKGNGAHWTWKSFEPSAKDDFSIELLRADRWQDLETARAAVKANPKDGQAYLDLAAIYRSLSLNIFTFSLFRFGPTYLPLGIEAYQKAVELMPDHPVPHAGLALLNLAQYRNSPSKDPAVLQLVQDEYQIAKELDAKNPSLLEESGNSRYILGWVEEALYPYNDATGTADVATATVEATIVRSSVTPKPSATATPTEKHTLTYQPTQTATVVPSATPQPPPATPTALAKLGQEIDQGQNLGILMAAGAIGVVVIGYLILRRSWKRPRKQE